MTENKRVQIIISDELILRLKKIQGRMILESTDNQLITFTQVCNYLLESKLDELENEKN